MPKNSPAVSNPVRRRARPMLLAVAAMSLAGCAAPGEIARPEAPPKVVAVDPATLDYAERAISEGRYADARRLMHRMAVANPKSVRVKLLQAEIVLASGDPNEAVRRFDEIAADPAVAGRAHQGRGLALLKLGKLADARKALERAVDLDPALWRAWDALGYVHDSARDWPKAGAAYDRALKENPRSARVHNNRGYSRMLQKRFDEALLDFDRAIGIDPKLDAARTNRQLTLAWQGRYSRAMIGVSRSARGNVLNNIGYIAMLRGDLPTAEMLFLRALEAGAAYHATAHRNLAYLNTLKEAERQDAARDGGKIGSPATGN